MRLKAADALRIGACAAAVCLAAGCTGPGPDPIAPGNTATEPGGFTVDLTGAVALVTVPVGATQAHSLSSPARSRDTAGETESPLLKETIDGLFSDVFHFTGEVHTAPIMSAVVTPSREVFLFFAGQLSYFDEELQRQRYIDILRINPDNTYTVIAEGSGAGFNVKFASDSSFYWWAYAQSDWISVFYFDGQDTHSSPLCQPLADRLFSGDVWYWSGIERDGGGLADYVVYRFDRDNPREELLRWPLQGYKGETPAPVLAYADDHYVILALWGFALDEANPAYWGLGLVRLDSVDRTITPIASPTAYPLLIYRDESSGDFICCAIVGERYEIHYWKLMDSSGTAINEPLPPPSISLDDTIRFVNGFVTPDRPYVWYLDKVPVELDGVRTTTFHRFDVSHPDQPATQFAVENAPGVDFAELCRSYMREDGRCMSLFYYDNRAGDQVIGVLDWLAGSLHYYRAVFDPAGFAAGRPAFDLFVPWEEAPLHFSASASIEDQLSQGLLSYVTY
jgi:hypothetical protein